MIECAAALPALYGSAPHDATRPERTMTDPGDETTIRRAEIMAQLDRLNFLLAKMTAPDQRRACEAMIRFYEGKLAVMDGKARDG